MREELRGLFHRSYHGKLCSVYEEKDIDPMAVNEHISYLFHKQNKNTKKGKTVRRTQKEGEQ